MPYRLGVDLGTTFTAAAVSDGGAEPTVVGLGNRALQVPSVLFLRDDGEFLVGEAAERRGLTEPGRIAREFKRRIGDHVPIMVAGSPFSPQALTAHLLRWVVETVRERVGEPPAEVVLTHPAGWGPFRLELLDQVAGMAGVGPVRRCTEPEAAAAQYAAQTRVAAGDRVVVYDLGGGTFDVCVLEKTDAGFRPLGTPEGVEHLGGVDFDEAVLRHVLAELGPGAAALDPDDPAVTVGLARLRRDCVEAKEALSVDVDTLVLVALPGLSTTVRLTRAELESMIRPALTETIAATVRALRSAQVEASSLRSILLVGGSSRIPLVAELLTRELSVPTAIDTHPKHDVALGSVRVGAAGADLAPTPPTLAAAARAEPVAASEAPTGILPTAAVFAATTEPSPDPTPAASPPAPPAATPRAPLSPAALQTPSPPAASPTPSSTEPEGGERRRGGLVRVLAVALAAVVLGVGAGLVLTLQNDGDPAADAPFTSAPPPTTSAASSGPTPATPTPTPTTAALPQAAEPLGDEVMVWPRVRDDNWDIALLNLATAEETPLTTGPLEDSFPVLSRDRRTVIYNQVTEDGPRLRVMGADGRGDRALVEKLPEGCGALRRPATTPDGQIVVMCAATEDPDRVLLNVLASDGTLLRRLGEIGWMGDPTVTPDGQSVIYWRNDAGDGDGGPLHRAPIDGSSPPQRLTGKDVSDADPVVSPDGSLIAFRRIIDGQFTVVVAPFDGTRLTAEPEPVSDGNNDQDPSWAPDGVRIVYKQGPNDDADLRIVNLKSGDSYFVVNNPEADTAPAWTAR